MQSMDNTKQEWGPTFRDADLVVKIRELNPHIVCALCAGYFIDATTITECSHTFCKSCIVKHFQTKKSCPECGQKIHETQPLNNLRSDRVMQDVVYKLVPNLFKSEQEAEAKFYRTKGIDFTQSGSHLLNIGTPLKYTSQKVTRDVCNAGVAALDAVKVPNCDVAHRTQYDEKVVLFLNMHSTMETELKRDGEKFVYKTIRFKPLSKKYVRCSSRIKVMHLERLLMYTLNLESNESLFRIRFYSGNDELADNTTMKKVFLSQFFSDLFPRSQYVKLTYEVQLIEPGILDHRKDAI